MLENKITKISTQYIFILKKKIWGTQRLAPSMFGSIKKN